MLIFGRAFFQMGKAYYQHFTVFHVLNYLFLWVVKRVWMGDNNNQFTVTLNLIHTKKKKLQKGNRDVISTTYLPIVTLLVTYLYFWFIIYLLLLLLL